MLVSFANFVASGYELTSTYTSDPSTVNKDLWFKHWPEWLRNNIDATCQPAHLLVNSQFFTNQTALSYTLTSIAITEDGASSTSPSLPYLDNVMGDCEVLDITMDFDRSQTQNPTRLAHGGACAIDVRAYSTCTTHGPNGLTRFNFSSLYNPEQGFDSPGSSSLIGTNATAKASLWWAQQLLLSYWFDTNIALYKAVGDPYSTYNSGRGIQQGAANFYRIASQQDIEKLDFFALWFEFTGTEDKTYYMGNRLSVLSFLEEPNMAGSFGPPIWLQADKLAKAMYSAVMTDLGQVSLPRSSNIVADPGVLHTFSKDLALIHDTAYIIGTPSELHGVVLDGTYEDLRDSIGSGPLKITPSVISTNYLCSVPKLKSTGNIFISILLADLVLLNAAWVVYCLIVERFFVRSPTAGYCEGCLRSMHELQPLGAVHKSNVSSAPSLPSLGFHAGSFATGYERVQPRATETSAPGFEPVQLRRTGSLERGYDPVQLRGNESSESLVGRAEPPGRS